MGISAQWYVGSDLTGGLSMHTLSLAALLRANEINDVVYVRRVAALKVMTRFLIVQGLLIVVSVITSVA